MLTLYGLLSVCHIYLLNISNICSGLDLFTWPFYFPKKGHGEKLQIWFRLFIMVVRTVVFLPLVK